MRKIVTKRRVAAVALWAGLVSASPVVSAMSTGSGIAVAGVAASLAMASKADQQAKTQAALQDNPALAVLEFDAARKDLHDGRPGQARKDLVKAAQHDPSASFAGGPAKLQAFVQRIDGLQARQAAADAQTQPFFRSPMRASLLLAMLGAVVIATLIGFLRRAMA